MNTAELANLLEAIAAALRTQQKRNTRQSTSESKSTKTRKPKQKDGNLAPRILGSEQASKHDLVTFIKQHNLPVRVDAKDSKQSLKRRLLRFYEQTQNPTDSPGNRRERGQGTSPELMQALSYLLGMSNAKKK